MVFWARNKPLFFLPPMLHSLIKAWKSLWFIGNDLWNIGVNFMSRFYIVYDMGQRRIGLAEAR